MKRTKLSLLLCFALGLILTLAERAPTQTGNQSDVTGTNSIGTIDVPPLEEAVGTTDQNPTQEQQLVTQPTNEQPTNQQQPGTQQQQPGTQQQQQQPGTQQQQPPGTQQQQPPGNQQQQQPGTQQQQPPGNQQQQPPPGNQQQQPPPGNQQQQPPPGNQQQPPPGTQQQPPPGTQQQPPPGTQQQPPPGTQQQPPPNQQPPNQPPANQPPANQQPPTQQPPTQPQPPPRKGNENNSPPNPIAIDRAEIPTEAAAQENSEAAAESEQQEAAAEAKETATENIEVDRTAYEQAFQQADFGEAVQQFEEVQAVEFSDQLSLDLYGQTPTIDEIASTLDSLFQITGKKAALIYVSFQKDQLEMLPVFPKALTAANRTKAGAMTAQKSDRDTGRTITKADRESVKEVIQKFRAELTDPKKRNNTNYLKYAQQLYQWVVAPLEADLKANDIDILIFTMDSGLRSVPIAALHDGKQFLIEKYGVAMVPSFGLTDTRYVDIRKMPILAMGASEFKELSPLPGVPLELSTIVTEAGRGESFLNEQFTLENFKSINKQQRFGIIHLATHGEFKAGDLSNSYIQFWNTKLSMDKLRGLADELGWNAPDTPPVELLVLSACKTAVGDEQAELGFAGLAVQTGVKTALASLWYVSDVGSLGLMSEFYKQLNVTPIKSEALRQAQLAMLRGQVRIENGQLRLSDGSLVPLSTEVAQAGTVNLSHPYFWSAYTMIGNWN